MKIKIKKFILFLLGVSILITVFFWIKSAFPRIEIFPQDFRDSKLEETKKSKVIFNKLSLDYLDDYVGVWGDGSASGEVKWEAVDSKYAQRSAPSAITHPLEFKIEPTKIDIIDKSKLDSEKGFYIEENYKYGALIGGYFSSVNELITSYKKFDVDKDSIKEEIVETMIMGGNHPPHFANIIKNGFIIFSSVLNAGGIDPAADGNGFYVRHQTYDNNKGLCCPDGYRVYRIIYERGSFQPVWEQEVKYLQVQD